MATYAIGDVQGCYKSLQRLVGQLAIHSDDRLWLAGDLVNRGPRSLDVLRWATDQGERLVSVLGNHEIHLLARADELSQPKKRDTLDEVLRAHDRDELFDWLRRRPVLHHAGVYVMVHAGLMPAWSVADAEAIAGQVAATLRAAPPARAPLLQKREDAPTSWDPAHPVRAKCALNAFTRLRVCDAKTGAMRLDFDGAPDDAPAGTRPWFEMRPRGETEVFVCGHWSMLGFQLAANRISLDSGCVYGNVLTAVRLEDRKVFTQRFCD
jgi:bis(5'-nucleosyl)-tetraphosphatase (symmetrical)